MGAKTSRRGHVRQIASVALRLGAVNLFRNILHRARIKSGGTVSAFRLPDGEMLQCP